MMRHAGMLVVLLGAGSPASADTRVLMGDRIGDVEIATMDTRYIKSTGDVLLNGQIVFDGASADITSGTDQDLRIAPNGAGEVTIEADSVGYYTMRVKSNTLTRGSTIAFVNQATDGIGAYVGWGNSLSAPLGGNLYFVTASGRVAFQPGGAAGEVVGVTSTGLDGPVDNVINGGDVGLVSGTRLLTTITTLVAADCDADAEVTREVKYSKNAGADITRCECVKTGGSYSWASPTGGDCT